MSESLVGARELLTASRDLLRRLGDTDHERNVEPADQLAAEHAVAVGVAELAGDPRPEPITELPARPILAKDLLITVDLVLRALQQNT